MTGDQDLHRVVATRLADHSQQYTTNRRAIVAGLAGAGSPITLPDLLAADQSLAQSSAYRSLSVLVEAGVVRRLVHGGDHAHFELAEHLTEHHHHLICESCGVVVDVTLPTRVETAMDRTFLEVAAASGFVAAHHAVDIYGTCPDCAAASA
jgi:Fur family transcriptional regulator, ferric uptake regulator